MAIKSKIMESCCDIICLQETKKEFIDQGFIRKFFPSSFDHFEFIPSTGESSGTIIIWKSGRFSGQVISHNEYAMNLEFVSMLFQVRCGFSPMFMHHVHRRVKKNF
jgi:exonuclease III